MVREDILAALRNALERGESPEQAKASLIIAGYPKEDVEQAAASLAGKVRAVAPAALPIPVPKEVKPEEAKEAKKEEKKKMKWWIWLLIGVILLGIILAVLFILKPF